MTDALSAMEYPHWLLVAGTLLVLLGFIGLAYLQRKSTEVNLTEMANENERRRPELEPNLAQTQTNRKANLAEQTRDRWAHKHRGTKEEPLDDRSQLSEKKPE
jgi:hypothetical protein